MQTFAEGGMADDPADADRIMHAQLEAVLGAFAEYNPRIPLVFDVDFGHTDPQLVIPNGGDVRIDPASRSIRVRY
jgi:muramoyltetrapeptide carboxypeptidase LdcA involved in peptidoglycan recycling